MSVINEELGTVQLKRKAIRGLIWTGGTRAITQLLTWTITLVVIRLLSPEDYGLIAMATVFVNLLTLIAEAGLGAALVQAPKVEELQLRAIFGTSLLIDGFLFAALLAGAPAIAHFFQEPRLVPIIWALAGQFVLSAFTVVPAALLARTLNFKSPSVIGLLAGIAASLTTLSLAIYGYGVWSLVLGTLLACLIKTVGLNIVCPFLKWPTLCITSAHRLVVFGGQIISARLLWHLYSQADTVIVGKLLGKEILGFYSVSMHLASLPVQRMSAVVNEVAFPAFARTQHDTGLVSEYVLKSARLLSLVSFPVLWGISSVAPEIVAVVLGGKWTAAALPLQLLPLVMPLALLSPFLNTVFQGIGHGAVVLRNVLTACVIMPMAFWLGAKWGLAGVCFAWLLGFPVVLIVNLRRMLPLIEVNGRDFCCAIVGSALSSAGMYSAVALARVLTAESLAAPSLLMLLVAVGTVTYIAMLFLANRNALTEAVGVFRLRPIS